MGLTQITNDKLEHLGLTFQCTNRDAGLLI